MPDWRLLMSSDVLRAVDLLGQPKVVTITRVTQGKYEPRERGKKAKLMPEIWTREFDVPLGCNSTNAKAISKLLGSTITEDWIGRSITLHPVEVDAFGEMKMAIRVMPRLPKEDRGPQRRQPQRPAASGQQAQKPPQQPAPPPNAPPEPDELEMIAARDREGQ